MWSKVDKIDNLKTQYSQRVQGVFRILLSPLGFLIAWFLNCYEES
jgi:hypothetical protein